MGSRGLLHCGHWLSDALLTASAVLIAISNKLWLGGKSAPRYTDDVSR